MFAFASCDLFTGPAGPAGSDLRSNPLLFVPATNLAEALAYSNSTVVATGYYGSIFTSTDGTSWTPATVQPTNQNTLFWVAYGGGRFVAASYSQIFVSTDEGESWAETLDYGSFNAQNGNSITGLAAGGGSFVVVGYADTNNGFIMRSSDGNTWTDVTPSTTPNQFDSVSYANGQFIAATNTGSLYRSSDGGLTWSSPTVIPQYSDTVLKIVYGNGRYLILGDYFILTTTDFSSFNTLYNYSYNIDFTSVTFNGSLFVILCIDSNNFWALWYTDGTQFYWPSGILPDNGGGYTDIQWVPWLNGGTHVISQMQAS